MEHTQPVAFAPRPKSLFPAGLFLIGIIGLPATLVRELHNTGDPLHVMRTLFIIIYAAWVVLETRITVGTSREAASDVDQGTLALYGSARMLTMLVALFGPSVWSRVGPLTWIALGLFVGGIALRLSAIHTLGRFYSHQVRTVSEHAVVSNGPYRWIRHPAYTGMALAHVGFVLLFCSPTSLLTVALLLVPSIAMRIAVEERVLMSSLNGYAEYARGRMRLLPLIW